MSKITQLNEKAIAYPVPKNACDFRLGEDGYLYMRWVEDKIKDPLAEYFDDEKIPRGNWRILGRPEELDIVQCVAIKGKEYKGSLTSFLQEKGINRNGSVIILIKQ